MYGNADPATIGLPAVAERTVGGVTFVVTHGTRNRVRAAVYDTDGLVMDDDAWADAIADVARARTRRWDGENVIGVGGHSHKLVDIVHDDVRLLNPGSVTGADPADTATMLTVAVENGTVDVADHEA